MIQHFPNQLLHRFRVFAYFAVLLFMVSIIFTSCNKTSDFEIDYKHAYFPKAIGHYVIYEVDSLIFDDFFDPPKYDTFRYQVKEVIESYFTDNAGREACRIERFYRADSTQGWGNTPRIWSSILTLTTAEKNEENQRFLKLLFPPEEGLAWMGNQYIQIFEGNKYLENWTYEYEKVDAPDFVNGISFDSTITVKQRDFETLIEKIYGIEKYAKHVGLIYKEIWSLKKQNVIVPWTQPESGFILKMQVSAFGNE